MIQPIYFNINQLEDEFINLRTASMLSHLASSFHESFFFFFFFFFCSSGCPGTHSVDQAGLELRKAGIKGVHHHAWLHKSFLDDSLEMKMETKATA